MTKSWALSPDHFPCGCMITLHGDGAAEGERRIVYSNRYVQDELGLPIEALDQRPLAALLTRASNIFFNSYVLPMLMHEGRCDEILLELIAADGGKIPVVANAVAEPDPDGAERVHWGLFNASRRDKLYSELLEARRLLEEKGASLYLQSITDELTGLLNRRELTRRGTLLVERARRTGRPLALLMLDVDHFKRLNDSLGHVQADRVLVQLGTLFRKYGRNTDVIARYGGEEFVFVLPEADAERAQGAAQRLHELAAEVASAAGPISVSIGISLATADDNPGYKVLLEQADQAVYAAKAAGRNCTRFFPSPA